VVIQPYDDDFECHVGTRSQEPRTWPWRPGRLKRVIDT
jgi:hypothetical protein